MTCIVGVQEKGRAWIGGDAASVSGSTVYEVGAAKVFRNGDYVIGGTTSWRMLDLLRYKLQPPPPPPGPPDCGFMVIEFVERLRECMKAGGFARKENEVESAGTILVSVSGRLFRVDSDYQVDAPAAYCAIGSGRDPALGALFATEGQRGPGGAGRRRAFLALEASAAHNAYVRPPFTLLSTEAPATGRRRSRR